MREAVAKKRERNEKYFMKHPETKVWGFFSIEQFSLDQGTITMAKITFDDGYYMNINVDSLVERIAFMTKYKRIPDEFYYHDIDLFCSFYEDTVEKIVDLLP